MLKFLTSPEAQQWLVPYRKPLAATLAALTVLLAREVLGAELPAGYSETIAAAIVGYLIPERGAVPPFVVIPTPKAPLSREAADPTFLSVADAEEKGFRDETPPASPEPPSRGLV